MNLFKKNYFLVIFIGLSLIFILTNIIFSSPVQGEDYQITIQHGDSLWTLADKFGTVKQKEIWINEVMKINNLSSSYIKTGDILTIPKGMEQFHLNHSTELAGDS